MSPYASCCRWGQWMYRLPAPYAVRFSRSGQYEDFWIGAPRRMIIVRRRFGELAASIFKVEDWTKESTRKSERQAEPEKWLLVACLVLGGGTSIRFACRLLSSIQCHIVEDKYSPLCFSVYVTACLYRCRRQRMPLVALEECRGILLKGAVAVGRDEFF